MAKSQIFGPPVLTYIYKHGGVFPVRRGHHDEEAFKTAYAILDQGEMLLVYAEGGRSRSRRAGRAETGHRPDRAGVRRADRPGRDPRLGPGAGLEAAALPEGDRSSSASRSSFPVEQGPPRAPARGRQGDLRRGAGDVRGARGGRPTQRDPRGQGGAQAARPRSRCGGRGLSSTRSGRRARRRSPESCPGVIIASGNWRVEEAQLLQ